MEVDLSSLYSSDIREDDGAGSARALSPHLDNNCTGRI